MVKKTRVFKTNDPTEHQIQSAFVTWCGYQEKKYPGLEWAFAVPNGGPRRIVTAVRLRSEGVRPGVPDWILPIPQAPYAGLAIEFKAKRGCLKPAQAAYLDALKKAGWRTAVVRSCAEAIKILKDYYAPHCAAIAASMPEQVLNS